MNRWTTKSAVAAIAAALMLPVTGAAQTPSPQPPAQAHLAQAKAALNDVTTTTLSARNKTQLAEVKRRLATLEKTVAAKDKASATATTTARSTANWGTEVAAIDKALTAILGPDSATGTSGVAGAAGTTGAAKTAGAELDAPTRASLTEVRKHLTAFATAMAGGKATAPEADPVASAAPASMSAPTASPAAQTPQPSSPTPPSNPTAPATAQAQVQSPTQSQGVQPQPSEQAARQHLTEARNTLNDLTELPAASQLAGDARSQVSQLISNFNELITTQAEWRASYAKVSANLASLLGPDAATTEPVVSGTPGAVGTSGAGIPNLDPGIRAKLIELRRNLSDFEKAVGGTAAAGNAAASASPAATDPSMAAAPPSTTPPTTPPATTPTSTPSPTPPAGSTPATTSPAAQGTTGSQAVGGNAELMRHVAAIEALLMLENEGGGLTLTKAQVEQLRTHWASLRQAIDKK